MAAPAAPRQLQLNRIKLLLAGTPLGQISRQAKRAGDSCWQYGVAGLPVRKRIAKKVEASWAAYRVIAAGSRNQRQALLALRDRTLRVRLPEGQGKHREGSPMQVQLDQMRQKEEQPSPLAVLLSSHCSPPDMSPSPQIDLLHLCPAVQQQPGSILQVEEHPSPLTTLPSSQLSPPCTMLSPQVTPMQVLLLTLPPRQMHWEPLQLNPWLQHPDVLRQFRQQFQLFRLYPYLQTAVGRAMGQQSYQLVQGPVSVHCLQMLSIIVQPSLQVQVLEVGSYLDGAMHLGWQSFKDNGALEEEQPQGQVHCCDSVEQERPEPQAVAALGEVVEAGSSISWREMQVSLMLRQPTRHRQRVPTSTVLDWLAQGDGVGWLVLLLVISDETKRGCMAEEGGDNVGALFLGAVLLTIALT